MPNKQKGQGEIEYLLLIAATIIIVSIVIVAITSSTNEGIENTSNAETTTNPLKELYADQLDKILIYANTPATCKWLGDETTIGELETENPTLEITLITGESGDGNIIKTNDKIIIITTTETTLPKEQFEINTDISCEGQAENAECTIGGNNGTCQTINTEFLCINNTNIVTNGNFSNDWNNWVQTEEGGDCDFGWYIYNNRANIGGGDNCHGNLQQELTNNANTRYLLTYTITDQYQSTYICGYLTPSIGDVEGTTINTWGTHQEILTPNETDQNIIFYGYTGNCIGFWLDDISFKQIIK
jgi:uncharacterized protein (UPF0333 family)